MDTEKLLGPPGTGKTSALLQKMEIALEEGIHPTRIAFLTFTTAARQEAIERVTARFSLEMEELPYFRTLHSIAYRALGMTPQTIVTGPQDMADFEDLTGVVFSRRDGRGFEDLDLPQAELFGAEKGDRLLAFDHYRRHNLATARQAYRTWGEDVSWYEVQHFTEAYRAWKDREGLLDFTDLLTQATDPLPVDVVFVDEAQDLSLLQWTALKRFARDAKRMYAAGDDDQAIFEWAGANPNAFVALPGRTHVLGRSHRLPRSVHRVAREIIERVQFRHPKTWAPRDEDGEVRLTTDPEMVPFDRDGTYLVLYRHHYLSADVEKHIRNLGLPYTRHDRLASGYQWGPAIVYWERLRKGRELQRQELDEVLAAMPGTRPARQRIADAEGTFNMARAREQTGLPLDDVPWYEALRRITAGDVQYLRAVIRHHGSRGLLETPRIRLSTIHAAKGAEADHVVLLTEMSWKVRQQVEMDPDPERRVFYVGVTRARQSLTIVGVHNPLFV